MNDRHLFVEFRARVVWLGLLASWMALAVIVFYAVRLGVFADARIWGASLGTAMGLTALAVIPWREVLRRPTGDLLLLLWSVLTLLLLSLASSVAGLAEPVFFLYFMVVAFSAAILSLPLHAMVTSLAVVGHVASSSFSDVAMNPESLVLEVLALVTVGVLTGMVAEEFRRQGRRASAQVEELERNSRRMEELARLKTDFVSVVSHELRTPLTSIIGSLATLSRIELSPGSPASKELLASARKQAERLRALIEDLLMVSRIDARALPQQPEPIDLTGFVPEAVAGVPGGRDRVAVRVEETSLETDPDHLRRIVTNLVDNALKYAPDSPVEVTVARHGDEVRITVADRGPGIAEQDRDRVFERFTQLQPPQTRETGGTGLGLSIVRSLAEAMGGRVWLEDTEGGGATFVVALPRSPGALRRQAAS